MDLGLNEVQSMLLKSARELLENECAPAAVRAAHAGETGYSEQLWRLVVDLGWTGLAIDEEYGGSGLSTLELVLLAEELGRALAPIPLLSTALLCAPAIQVHGTDEQRQRHLPAIARDGKIYAFALTEPSGRYDPEGVQLPAVPDGDGFLLTGTKLFVRDGAIANWLLLAARTSLSEHGITVFLVDAALRSVQRTRLDTVGDDRQAGIRLDGVRVPAANVLGTVGGGWPIIEEVLARGILGECAELAGVGRMALERTVAYAADRVQFGRPIGSFQAIQHMCADMALAVDGIQLSTRFAASRFAAGLPASTEIAQARVFTSDSIWKVVRDAQQIHAGIAFIKDHDLHLYYNRAKAGELFYGIGEAHRERVAAALLDR
jgi:alkylation response protein AidB-like acyl-CoA dehydrogenase